MITSVWMARAQQNNLFLRATRVYEILRAEEDEFIILACDGIWDVMSNEELWIC